MPWLLMFWRRKEPGHQQPWWRLIILVSAPEWLKFTLGYNAAESTAPIPSEIQYGVISVCLFWGLMRRIQICSQILHGLTTIARFHDDFITWNHFPHYWILCVGKPPVTRKIYPWRGQRDQCNPYKPCNHNIYYGIIHIFPHIDNTESTSYS